MRTMMLSYGEEATVMLVRLSDYCSSDTLIIEQGTHYQCGETPFGMAQAPAGGRAEALLNRDTSNDTSFVRAV